MCVKEKAKVEEQMGIPMESSLWKISEMMDSALLETLSVCERISKGIGQELAKLPMYIDVLGDALHGENLKETAHSRILCSILQDKQVLRSFIARFLPDIADTLDNICIPYPDRHRIDLTIMGESFFLIVENKVNGACEQANQIDRYFEIASKTHPCEEIYVLYLNGDKSEAPSEYSLSIETREAIGSRLVCRNFKDDIAPWIGMLSERVDFSEQPLLKSALIAYRTYLENKYQLSNQFTEMDNKIDKQIIKDLGLEQMPLSERVSVLQDQVNNVDKILERLNALLADYQLQNCEAKIRTWYGQCVSLLGDTISLTMAASDEFGFDFVYRNTSFRCCVSFDEGEDVPYWGIKGVEQTNKTKPRIFEGLRNLVLRSNKGFHNCEANASCWAVSDYETDELIVERFVALTKLILSSDQMVIK